MYSFKDGHLGFFQKLATVNYVAVNIGVHRFFQIGVSGFLVYNVSSGIARWKGSSIFSFLRKFHTVFHSCSTSLHSHQQCTRVPISPQPRQSFFFVDSFMVVSVKWYPIVVLIFASLMASDAEHPLCHFYIQLLPSFKSWIYSSEKLILNMS